MGPRSRQTVYYLGTIVSSALGIALLFHGVSSGAADSINQIVAGLVALLGGAAPAATAARAITKQRQDGAFDSASPADQAIDGINQAVAQVQNAASDLNRIKDAASDVLGQLPVIGPLAQQVIDSVKIP